MHAMDATLERLNATWHRPALWAFIAIVFAHISEHVVQAVQIYALGWEEADSLGLLGLAFPWLVTSEWMHFLYGVLTLAGVALLLPAFVGKAWLFWFLSLAAQLWHYIEHQLLLIQRLLGEYWFGGEVPTSIVQVLVPRVELHLFYNAIVVAPMLIALAYHLYPSEDEAKAARCGCALRRFFEPAGA